MARNLALKPQVLAPNSEYPYGRIQDDTSTGADDGTPVNEEVYGDMHQFFAKLMAVAVSLGNAPYNNEPENAYDGFQYYEALAKVITFAIDLQEYNEQLAAWTALPLVNNWIDEPSGNFQPAQYHLDPYGWVHLRGHIKRNAGTTGEGVVIATLPATARPIKIEEFTKSARNDTALAASPGRSPVLVTVSSSGTIVADSFYGTSMLSVLNNTDDYLCLDGISFKTDIANP